MKKRQAIYHWNNEQKKKCPVCKEWFPRPKGKSNKVWEAQECCGRDCSNISRRKPEKEIKGKMGISRRKELTPGANRFTGRYCNTTSS